MTTRLPVETIRGIFGEPVLIPPLVDDPSFPFQERCISKNITLVTFTLPTTDGLSKLQPLTLEIYSSQDPVVDFQRFMVLQTPQRRDCQVIGGVVMAIAEVSRLMCVSVKLATETAAYLLTVDPKDEQITIVPNWEDLQVGCDDLFGGRARSLKNCQRVKINASVSGFLLVERV